MLKNAHRLIKFLKKSQLKRYIDMNTDLGKAAKNDLIFFFKLINNSFFRKNMENV